MTETSPPWGDQPLVPSTRVTEAELLEWEAERSALSVTCEHYDGMETRALARAAVEIRRYRALLLGLAANTCGCLSLEGFGHQEDCAWCDVEAEVAAIRAERKQS